MEDVEAARGRPVVAAIGRNCLLGLVAPILFLALGEPERIEPHAHEGRAGVLGFRLALVNGDGIGHGISSAR
jgi:hypothetical protein